MSKEGRLNPIEEKALRNSDVALGYALGALRADNHSQSTFDFPIVALRTLYRVSKRTMPDDLKEAIDRKGKFFVIDKATLLHVGYKAAELSDDTDMADSMIAACTDMPVFKLSTRPSFVKGTYGVTRNGVNNIILKEIFRFASYTCMGAEMDMARSKTTKGNIIHLCCSEKFMKALENANVPGVGKFLPVRNPVAAQPSVTKDDTLAKPAQRTEPSREVWPWPPAGDSEKVATGRELPPWPFPGSGPKPAN